MTGKGKDSEASAVALARSEGACPACAGHGDIWTSWSGNRPVTCGYCHGTGRATISDGLQTVAPADSDPPAGVDTDTGQGRQ